VVDLHRRIDCAATAGIGEPGFALRTSPKTWWFCTPTQTGRRRDSFGFVMTFSMIAGDP
jgi:hypothetical protein